MELLRCGFEGALIEVEDRDALLALHAAWRARRPKGVLELVPAARTLLVRFDPRQTSFEQLRENLAEAPLRTEASPAPAVVVVPVRYNGADLAEVAEATGLSQGDVIRRHTERRYTVAFCGFAPGFAYLTGLDPVLHMPRRSSPRVSVPAGSVALADEYTGIYPRSSPGGWRLIGTTELTVWDPCRTPPAVLTPGTSVQFEVVGQ